MLTRMIFSLVLAIGCLTLLSPNYANAEYANTNTIIHYSSQVADPVTGSQGSSNPSCIIREGLQVMMQNVSDTIDKDTDGHVELSFRNPLINDCVIQAELRIVTPNELLVFGKEGVVSGGAGTLNAVATVPPGTERISVMDFKGTIVSLRKVRGNTPVSYGGIWISKEETTIGVIQTGLKIY